MKYFGTVFFASLARNAVASPGPNIVDVCVVGAGPSGVQAAYTAEDRGFTTAIFEKNSYVGGKTKAVYKNNPKTPYMMGAGMFRNSFLSSSKVQMVDIWTHVAPIDMLWTQCIIWTTFTCETYLTNSMFRLFAL